VCSAALGFASWQRALISRAGQTYVLEQSRDEQGDTLKIVTQDLRGTSELELPLSGQVNVHSSLFPCRAAQTQISAALTTLRTAC
jgi:hypothetical protein